MSKQQLPQEKRWYAIHTYSGYEDAVAASLQKRAESLDMKEKIFDVLIPKQKKKIIKNNKKIEIEEKLYKGYVLVEMIVDDDSWYIVRNTPNVTGFIGSGVTPVPVSSEEMDSIKKRTQISCSQVNIKYKANDPVKINSGPFKGFDANILAIDSKKEKVKVLIDIFGRSTSVELDIFQIDKI